MQINHFLLLKKFKNTESAQLCYRAIDLLDDAPALPGDGRVRGVPEDVGAGGEGGAAGRRRRAAQGAGGAADGHDRRLGGAFGIGEAECRKMPVLKSF